MKPVAAIAPFVGIGMILVWIDAATILAPNLRDWLPNLAACHGDRADVGYIRFAANRAERWHRRRYS